MSKTRPPPKWEAPTATPPELRLYNSLTRSKNVFVPKNGNKVLWYGCGPTVYDAAHMGHARAYISFDIIRRILRDYFGYNIFYCMNITDIDDKIIKRARQKHLFKQYSTEEKDIKALIEDCSEALLRVKEKHEKEENNDKKLMYEKMIKKITAAIAKGEKNDLLSTSEDALSDWLDSKFGSTISDNSIFAELPAFYEKLFFTDMKALNVENPDILTRVSEFVPEIVKYIQKIILNGYAYNSNGSVYFDVAKFNGMEKHYYAKLVPEAVGDLAALAEGEGDLSTGALDKKSPGDFALWKASKPGEPSWDSPWGKGRPGWHIECSVMATSALGPHLDIHSGGCDLKFPHHDNEIAQSEAYSGSSQWVDYFLHAGHLTIDGCKMSKSLKNFVSISEALQKHTSRQIRLAFLLHGWNAGLDYGEQTMISAFNFEKRVTEFFITLKSLFLSAGTKAGDTFVKWSSDLLDLNSKFLDAKENVNQALCDNLDTRSALESISTLLTSLNTAFSNDLKDLTLLMPIVAYLNRIFKVFGLTKSEDTFAWLNSNPESGEVGSSADFETKLMPYLQATASFRDEIRAKFKDPALLKLCDSFRDDVLPELGVRLEDKSIGAASVVKLIDPSILKAEREAAKQVEEAKRLKKLAQQEEQRLKLEKAKQSPVEMFLREKEFALFDRVTGLPTHSKGVPPLPITKSQAKKVKKLWDAQLKKHNEFLISQGQAPLVFE